MSSGQAVLGVDHAVGLTCAIGFRSAVADINGDGYPDLLLQRQCFYDTGTSGIQHLDAGAVAGSVPYFYLVTAFSPSCGESAAP